MFKKNILVLILLVLAACGSVKKHNSRLGTKFPPEQLRKDVDFTYNKLQQLHPRLYQYISKEKLDFKFDSLKRSITKPLNAKEFYTILAPVVSEVRQGHIVNGFPDRRFTKKERKLLQKTKLDFFELDMKYLDDGLWISRAAPKDSLLVGSQVVAVGMETSADILKKYNKTFSPDGYITTFQNRFITHNFTSAYTKHEGYKDSIPLVLMHDDSVFVKHFKRYLKDSSGLKPRVVDTAKTTQKSLVTQTEKKAKKAKLKVLKKQRKNKGYIARRDQYTRNFSFLDSAAQIGYFQIRAWSNGPYKKFYNESFARLDSSKAQHLIIDIRDNSGGRLDEVHEFYSYLTNTDFQFVTPFEVHTRVPTVKSAFNRKSPLLSILGQSLLVPYYLADNLVKTRKTDGTLYYRTRESKITAPKPLNFKGKIYVLINGGSFSASSLLASKLHGTKRAVFIGEETGGAYNGTVAGQFKVIVLPHTELAFKFGLMQVETPHHQNPDGYGVKPDINIIPTSKDLRNQRDPELEQALDLIKQELP